jgi:hypothetical protein
MTRRVNFPWCKVGPNQRATIKFAAGPHGSNKLFCFCNIYLLCFPTLVLKVNQVKSSAGKTPINCKAQQLQQRRG